MKPQQKLTFSAKYTGEYTVFAFLQQFGNPSKSVKLLFGIFT
jgi:hypothetical protein